MSALEPRNTVIRASAGSGKTYQLTNRFLGLVAAGEPCESILATTFTRKAAGEILGRMLTRLAEAAVKPRELTKLAADLGDPNLDRSRCLALLSEMIRRLHRIRVSTLDSFFIQVARSFSLELGLPPGWQIVDEIDDERLRAEAIRAVLDDESTGDAVKLMHLLTKGEAARSVSEQIRLIVRDLYSLYVEAPAGAWSALPRHKPMEDRELREAIEQFASAELPADKRFAKARDDGVASAERGDWVSFLAKGLLAKILDGSERFGNKPIPPEVVEACRPLIRHARAVIVGQIASQTEATHRLLEHFDRAYERLKLGHRSLRFEDVTRKLADAWTADRLEDAAYRLDSNIAHLLLDEFQDTSPLQWRVLRPIARTASDGSPAHSFFCVGDVKQAIYGWRGGAAEIFDALDGELPGLAAQSLNQSWRSSAAVIETVNRAFENLASNPALERYAEAAKRWAGRFQPHSTAKQLPGYCRMVAAPQAEGENQSDAMARFAADQVAALREQAPGCSIGVLVRRNAAVARLIYELRTRGVEASEEGGNPLTDSAGVQLILSLLTLADHPGHRAARHHVAHSPLGAVLGYSRHEDDAAAARLALSVRRDLLERGYGSTIDGWVRRLAPHSDSRDLDRLVQLVELAHGYDPRATLRADDFVVLVERKRVDDPKAAQVRVMTVHQAKGLEFDIVVLPELDVLLSGQPPQLVVGRPGPAQDADRVLRYVARDLRPLLPERFAAMFDEHECRVVEESLCVLYVALTRAVHALHILVSPSADNEGSVHATAAGLLRASLTDGRRLEPGEVAYEAGDPQWHRCIEKTEPVQHGTNREDVVEDVSPRSGRVPAPKLQRGLERRAPSTLDATRGVRLADRLRLEPIEALDRGSVLHAWFELIEWLDDGPPNESTLRAAVAAMPIAPSLDLRSLLEKFRKAIAQPAVRAALCQATYQQPCLSGPEAILHAGTHLVQPRWQVWRERTFAYREAGAITSGKIDRLVVLYDGDRPVAADVIDFKTDALRAGDPEAIQSRADIYRAQLEAYRRGAARLVGIDPEKVVARLVFTEPGEIVAFAPAGSP